MPEYKETSEGLGKLYNIGPIPGNMLLPWLIIFFGFFVVARIAGISIPVTLAISCWGMVTWWVLAGKRNWLFLAKFLRMNTPKLRKGRYVYKSLLTVKKRG